MSKRTHFSYVDIIVAAIVLVTVGRIITPQFTKASDEETKISELADSLEAMRAKLDLYRAQHRDIFPPTDSFASFERAMTTKIGQHGPYVKRIPTNPFNGLKTVRFDGEPAGSGKAGWRLDTQSGSFQADNDAAYSAL